MAAGKQNRLPEYRIKAGKIPNYSHGHNQI